MPRYVLERDFGQVSEDEMQQVAARSKVIGSEHFPNVLWQGSHVCAGDDGAIKAFCVYESPEPGQIKDFAGRVGGHEAMRVYEIVGELSPEGARV